VTFEPTLVRMTALLRRLRIPVVILGVGSQASTANDTSRLRPIAPSVAAFLAAALERGPSIGVRGELTLDYLGELGFREAEVIGCPSMFLHGDRLDVREPPRDLAPDARIALNVSPYVTAMGPVVARHAAAYRNLTYVAQDLDTLELLLGGPGADVPPDDPRPIHRAHRLVREDRIRMFTDPPTWFDFLAGQAFSFGTRIHGNIAALLAGTPAVVLAHDSRTLELARYFDIPHRLMADADPSTIDARELAASADLTALRAGHADRLATFVTFLERHGLDHRFRSPAAEPSFEARVAATVYPPAVSVRPAAAVGPSTRLVRAVRRRLRTFARSRTGRQLRLALQRRGTAAAPEARAPIDD
jgi:hypothetical protein